MYYYPSSESTVAWNYGETHAASCAVYITAAGTGTGSAVEALSYRLVDKARSAERHGPLHATGRLALTAACKQVPTSRARPRRMGPGTAGPTR
jgi:hypothetical protein